MIVPRFEALVANSTLDSKLPCPPGTRHRARDREILCSGNRTSRVVANRRRRSLTLATIRDILRVTSQARATAPGASR